MKFTEKQENTLIIYMLSIYYIFKSILNAIVSIIIFSLLVVLFPLVLILKSNDITKIKKALIKDIGIKWRN